MSKSQRVKGRAYEQHVARQLRCVFDDDDVHRGWQTDGRVAPDVQAGPLAVECKHRKAINVREAMADAEAHAPQGCIPVVWARWQGGDEVVCMRSGDWLEIIATWWKEVNA